MLWLGALIVILGTVIIYLVLPGGRLWHNYLKEVKISMAETSTPNELQDIFTEERILKLPDLLQKHIINGGYLGQPIMTNMHIYFRNTDFRMSPDEKPIKIDFQQINFVQRPDRHAFLSGRVFGIPLHAKDTIKDGVGSLTGVIAKQFQLFHSTGSEMNQGQLITALADAVFMPSLFLQDYVKWTTIDDHTLEGQITWKGVSAKGRFTFNEDGDIIRFDTNDRYMDQNGKGSVKRPWFIICDEYEEKNSLWQPNHVRVCWVLPEGEDNYFESNDIKVFYSINENDLLW